MKLLLLVLMTVALWGQSSAKVIMLKHMNADTASLIAQAFGDGKVNHQRDPRTQMIVLSGPPDLLTAIENAIQKADVPDKPALNVELTFYVLVAGDAAAATALPEELAGVARQVKALFGYPTLRLLDSIQVRSRDGKGGEASGIMGKTQGSLPNQYQLRFTEVNLQGAEKARTLRLKALKFGTKIAIGIPTGTQYLDTGINTDIDFRAGQKIVIGKSSLDSSGTLFFVVVTGKVVD